jgi:cell wall assembly regulator SMI1
MNQRQETQQSFDELLGAIDELSPSKVAATFQPPVDDQLIFRIEQLLGISMPDNLRKLLKWHNGQDWNAPLREGDNRRLLSAGEIIETLAFFQSPDEDFLGPWGRFWIPFLTNDAGDYVVVDASPGCNEKLINYWHDWEDRSIAYQSLSEWAAGLIYEFKQTRA